jgi:hypothetical protein
VSLEVIDLIHSMSLANFGWGAPRIHGELLKLGFELSQATVSVAPGRGGFVARNLGECGHSRATQLTLDARSCQPSHPQGFL